MADVQVEILATDKAVLQSLERIEGSFVRLEKEFAKGLTLKLNAKQGLEDVERLAKRIDTLRSAAGKSINLRINTGNTNRSLAAVEERLQRIVALSADANAALSGVGARRAPAPAATTVVAGSAGSAKETGQAALTRLMRTAPSTEQFVPSDGELRDAARRAMSVVVGTTDAEVAKRTGTGKTIGERLFGFNNLVFAADAVTNALGAAVTPLISFDRETQRVSALGVTNIQDLQTVALDFARRFPSDPIKNMSVLFEALSSSTAPVKNGIADVAQVSAFLEAAIKGAGAGLSDTTAAARAIIQTLNAYGLQAKDAVVVTDAFAATVAASGIRFEEISEQFGRVSAAAARLHVPIVDLAGTLGLLKDRGLPAEAAAAGLSIAMTKLVKPSKAGERVLHAMGVTIDNLPAKIEAAGGLPSFFKSVVDFGKTKFGLPLEKIFPDQRSIRALGLMLNNFDTFESKLNGIRGAVKETGKATDELSSPIFQSLEERINQTNAQIDAMAITLGQQLPQSAVVAAVALQRFGPVLLPLTFALPAVASGFKALIPLHQALVSVASTPLNPKGLLGSIQGFAHDAEVRNLQKGGFFGGLRGGFAGVVDAGARAADTARTFFGSLLRGGTILGEVTLGLTLLSAGSAQLRVIMGPVADLFSELGAAAGGDAVAFEHIIAIAKKLFGLIGDIAAGVLNFGAAIVDFVGVIAGSLVGLLTGDFTILDGIIADTTKQTNQLRTAMEAPPDIKGFRKAFADVQNDAQAASKGASEVLARLPKETLEALDKLPAGIKEKFNKRIGEILDLEKPAEQLGELKKLLQDTFNFDVTTNAAEGPLAGLSRGIDTLREKAAGFTEFGNKLREGIVSGGAKARQVILELRALAEQPIETVINVTVHGLGNVVGQVGRAVVGVPPLLPVPLPFGGGNTFFKNPLHGKAGSSLSAPPEQEKQLDRLREKLKGATTATGLFGMAMQAAFVQAIPDIIQAKNATESLVDSTTAQALAAQHLSKEEKRRNAAENKVERAGKDFEQRRSELQKEIDLMLARSDAEKDEIKNRFDFERDKADISEKFGKTEAADTLTRLRTRLFELQETERIRKGEEALEAKRLEQTKRFNQELQAILDSEKAIRENVAKTVTGEGVSQVRQRGEAERQVATIDTAGAIAATIEKLPEDPKIQTAVQQFNIQFADALAGGQTAEELATTLRRLVEGLLSAGGSLIPPQVAARLRSDLDALGAQQAASQATQSFEERRRTAISGAKTLAAAEFGVRRVETEKKLREELALYEQNGVSRVQIEERVQQGLRKFVLDELEQHSAVFRQVRAIGEALSNAFSADAFRSASDRQKQLDDEILGLRTQEAEVIDSLHRQEGSYDDHYKQLAALRAQIAAKEKEKDEAKRQVLVDGLRATLDAQVADSRATLDAMLKDGTKFSDTLTTTLTTSLGQVGTAILLFAAQGKSAGESIALGFGLGIINALDAIVDSLFKTLILASITDINPALLIAGTIAYAAAKAAIGFARAKVQGFEEGGWTGAHIAHDRIAGVVHGQEWVANRHLARKHRTLFGFLDDGGSEAAYFARYGPAGDDGRSFGAGELHAAIAELTGEVRQLARSGGGRMQHVVTGRLTMDSRELLVEIERAKRSYAQR